MLIDYTPEEVRQIKEIQNKYAKERKRLQTLLSKEMPENPTEEDEARRYALLAERQELFDRIQNSVESFISTLEQKRFKLIKEAGTDAIIYHAKTQVPLLLDYIYDMTKKDYEGFTSDILKSMGVGQIRDNKIYLNANYVAQILRNELQLHFEALMDNREALQGLYEAVIEEIERCDFTDGSDITDLTKKPLTIRRYRRNPLTDVKTYGILNDKANAQLLQDGEIFQQKADGQLTLRWAVNQSPSNSEPVPVYMALTYEGDDYRVTKKLTSYDKQVYEAVSTRFYYWQQANPQTPLYITPQEVWRTMNGKKSGGSKISNPSKAQVQRICDSLDKMRFTRFNMDISKEISAFNLSIDDERINGGHIETYVLNSSKVEFTTDKGNTVQGYRIGEEPILYTYSKAKKHIIYVPYEMLDTSQYTSDSENVAEFKGYLLQQIQLMKNAKEEDAKEEQAKKRGKTYKRKYMKRNNKILLDTIYKDTGIEPPEERLDGRTFNSEASRQTVIRRLRKADRGKIEGILDAWTDKEWIKGYEALNAKKEPAKDKQQVTAYSIFL